MEISRNKFSNTICVIFSVVLVGLFCVSNSVRFGLNNIVSCAIIAAVICGLVAFLAFTVNRLVRKIGNDVTVNDKLIYMVSMITVSLLYVVIRLLMISNIISVSMNLGANYEAARIGAEGTAYFDLSTADGVITTLISLFLKFLGNTSFPIIIVQFVLSTAGYVLLLFGVKDILGRLSSFITCLCVAVAPVFYQSIASDTVDCLAFFAFALVVFVTAKYKKSMDLYDAKAVIAFLIGLLTGFLGLYNKAFAFAFVLPLVVICGCNSESAKNKAANACAIVLGDVIGAIAPLMVDSYLIKGTGIESFVTDFSNYLYGRFAIHFSTKMVGTMVANPWVFGVMIACIFYCVFFWKNNDDSGHIFVTFLIVMTAQAFFTQVYGNAQLTEVYLLCMAAVAGYGFGRVGFDPNFSSVYKIEDDMEPAIVQSIGNKVVTSDEEIDRAFAEAAEKEKKVNLFDEYNKPASDEAVVTDKEPVSAEITQSIVEKPKEEELHEEDRPYEPVVLTLPIEEVKSTDIEEIPVERKYNEAESRKTEDFGMNNDAFASLFSGSSLPPKFARGDMYDDYDNLEENEEASVSENESNAETETVTEFGAKPELNAVPEIESEQQNNKAEADDFVFEPFDGMPHEDVADTKTEDESNNGINDVDFASLFAGTNLPPKFARKGYYEDDLTEEEASEDNLNEAEQSVDEAAAEPESDNSEAEKEAEGTKEEQKAYVDTFFGYLYDESVFDQPIEEIKPKVEEDEKYVSNAAKFADLELDLGIDAFDNIFVEKEVKAEPEVQFESEVQYEPEVQPEPEVQFEPEVQPESGTVEGDFFDDEQNQVYEEKFDESDEFKFIDFDNDGFEKNDSDIINIEDEFEFDDSPNDVVLDEEQPAESETYDVAKEEFSFEESLQKKIDSEGDFSYEDAITKRLEEEAQKEEMGFSYEEALEKKLAAEASINEAAERMNFSYEEALAHKIALEEAASDAQTDENISVEEILAMKVEVEDSLNAPMTEDAFSFQEAIEQKIDAEKDIEFAMNEAAVMEYDIPKQLEEEIMAGMADFNDSAVKETVADFDAAVEQETETGFETSEVKETFADFETDAINEIPVDADYSGNFETVQEDVISFEEPANSLNNETTTENPEPEKKTVEFIENPLPLPKKHVHRELDYGRSVPENWMHFDVDVNKNNNFFDI